MDGPLISLVSLVKFVFTWGCPAGEDVDDDESEVFFSWNIGSS
jgi:hypothetical protein